MLGFAPLGFQGFWEQCTYLTSAWLSRTTGGYGSDVAGVKGMHEVDANNPLSNWFRWLCYLGQVTDSIRDSSLSVGTCES